MGAPAVLLISIGAFTAAPLAAAFALTGRAGSRSRVARTLAAAEQAYQLGPGARVAAPADEGHRTSRLGRLVPAFDSPAMLGRLQRLLDQAGNPPAWPVELVAWAKGAGLVAGLLGGALFGLLLGGPAAVALVAVLGAVAGFFGPDLAIYNMGLKRQQALRMSLPDIFDTLVICVEAGQGFDAALAQIAHNGRGPMAGEAARVLHEMRLGKSRVDALRALGARTTVPELRSFVAAVVQASEMGIAIGPVLREQAKEMRVRRRQRAEEVAQKVPVKILFPTLLCLLPSIFVVVLGPAVIRLIHIFVH